jgi:hypothetical protein
VDGLAVEPKIAQEPPVNELPVIIMYILVAAVLRESLTPDLEVLPR